MAVIRPTFLPQPPYSTPVLGPNGLISQTWLQYENRVVQFIATLTQRGSRADQPPATSVFPGTVYYVTDDMVHERSNGEIWESWG